MKTLRIVSAVFPLLALVLPPQASGLTQGPATSVPKARGLVVVPSGPATPDKREVAPEVVARRFMERTLAPAGEMALVSVIPGAGGVRFATFEQRFDGIPVYLGRVTVAVGADGRAVALRAGALATAGPTPNLDLRRLVDADAARARAGHRLGARAKSPRGDWVEPPAREVLLPTRGGSERAWRVRAAGKGGTAKDLLLAASDGRELGRVSLGFQAIAEARWWPGDPTGPSALVAVPDPQLAPSYDSPLGWDDANETVGNNVHVFLDRAATRDPEGARTAAASGDPATLDFPYTGDIDADVDAALTNVFVVLNRAHDHFRRLGFDEASGALQEDSFSRGGVEGDRLYVGVQYGSDDGTVATNRMGMEVYGDGGLARLSVGLFELEDTGELRDGAFEEDLLIHEYAHAVMVRMLDGETGCFSGRHPSALAEGTADFLAASMTDDPVIGAWTAGDPQAGHRDFALDESPLSYVQFCADDCNTYRDALIWSGALWDLRTALQAELGAEAGRDMAERLVVESLRYLPCQPTYSEGRDAILLADRAINDSAQHCAVWSAFQGRGIGVNASETGPNDDYPFFDFGLPPECRGSLAMRFDAEEYGLAGPLNIDVFDASPGPAPTLTLSSSSGDVETLDLLSVPGGVLLRAGLDLAEGAPAPGDGVLQVSDGDELTASLDAQPDVTASSVVVEAMVMDVVGHYVGWSGCQAAGDDDHADAPGWWVLPGFLDAGENVGIAFDVLNRSPVEIPGATVRITSTNPNVTILPRTPIQLGTLPAGSASATDVVGLTVQAIALPTVVAGETAELLFEFEAEGRRSVVPFTLLLNMDYEVEESVSPFAGGVETFDAGSPTLSGWTHAPYEPGGADDWRVLACGGVGGSGSVANAGEGCTGYQDEQSAPVLLSPPLMAGFDPDVVAYRNNQISWQANINFYADPANPYCDLDQVGVYFTADPASLPYDTPGDPWDAGPQRVYNFNNNTGGVYAAGGPYGIDRSPTLLVEGLPYDQYRMAFLFWSDVIDCGVEYPNTGSFYIDDFVFTQDVVHVVPETTPCDADCSLWIAPSFDPPGPKCEGEAFTISVVSDAEGCTDGVIYHAFGGPGVPPEYGWTLETSAPAVGADDGLYTVYASCETDAPCGAYRELTNVSPAGRGVGGPYAGTLRLRRDGTDVVFDWSGASDPQSYGVFGGDRSLLGTDRADWPLLAAVDGEGSRGEVSLRMGLGPAASGATFYSVHGRNPCTDEAIVP